MGVGRGIPPGAGSERGERSQCLGHCVTRGLGDGLTLRTKLAKLSWVSHAMGGLKETVQQRRRLHFVQDELHLKSLRWHGDKKGKGSVVLACKAPTFMLRYSFNDEKHT